MRHPPGAVSPIHPYRYAMRAPPYGTYLSATPHCYAPPLEFVCK